MCTVRDGDEVASLVRSSGRRGVLARGLGRSYGDAAQAVGAMVLDLSRLRSIDVDMSAGTVTAGAGASLASLLRVLVPAGWFLPVTPGTGMVTVGGAIAADVHGRNHHVEGTFGSHVSALTLVDGRGEIRRLTPRDTPDGFWATVGGMGLTGVILDATFDLIPITSALVGVDTDRAPNLVDLMSRMASERAQYRYCTAWIDSTHPSGRGMLIRGDHVPADWLPACRQARALDYHEGALMPRSYLPPVRLVNPVSTRVMNESRFRRTARARRGELQTIHQFFHPLHRELGGNQIYGRNGVVRYQFAVPEAAGALVGKTLRRMQAIGACSPVTELQLFGIENAAPLSFPTPGWMLAVDVPAGIDGLARVLERLDAEVLAAGGRVFLATDARLSPLAAAGMYPRLAEWQRIRDDMDPNLVFNSDLATRLSL